MLEKKILLTVLALFYKTKGAMFKVNYCTLNTTRLIIMRIKDVCLLEL